MFFKERWFMNSLILSLLNRLNPSVEEPTKSEIHEIIDKSLLFANKAIKSVGYFYFMYYSTEIINGYTTFGLHRRAAIIVHFAISLASYDSIFTNELKA